MLSLIMSGGVVLSMWLDFTPPQWKNVAGVQGRYFLPFLPMLVLMLKGKTDTSSGKILQRNHDFHVYSRNPYSF